MNFWNTFLQWDGQGVLALNGLHTPTLDNFAWLLSETMVWIPAAVVFTVVLVRNKRLETLFILLALALMIVFADQISSGLLKPLVARPRPTRNMELIPLIEVVNGYHGGRFGFPSSHAANVFAFAMFSSLLFRHRPYGLFAFVWALLISLSRVYLAVHYPSDVFCGMVLGLFSGFLFYRLLSLLTINSFQLSAGYTPSHFLCRDVRLVLSTLLLSLLLLLIASCVLQ